MKLADWNKKRIGYITKTRDENPEFMNLADDTPFQQRVHEQALREVFDRLEALEATLAPVKKEYVHELPAKK